MSANEISKGEAFDATIFSIKSGFLVRLYVYLRTKKWVHKILLSRNLLQEGKIGTKEYITPNR